MCVFIFTCKVISGTDLSTPGHLKQGFDMCPVDLVACKMCVLESRQIVTLDSAKAKNANRL